MNNSTNMDYTSLINILNKIKLYKENQDKIIINIKDILYKLDNTYISNNNKYINEKTKELIISLNELSNHKEEYIRYLEKKIKDYTDFDYETYLKYNNLNNN